MGLDFNSTLPLHVQIREILRAELVRQDQGWTPECKLPSENQLCHRYGVTRPTVRQALEQLVHEGLVYKRHGQGAFVSKPAQAVGFFSLAGTSETFAQHDLSVQTTVLGLAQKTCCPWAENPESKDWLRLVRLRRINRVPTFFEYSWLRLNPHWRITKQVLTNASFYQLLLEQRGLHVCGGTQQFSAVVAPEQVVRSLGLQAGVPILRVRRTLDLRKQASSGAECLSGALRVELYIAEGSLVLEQAVPVVSHDLFAMVPDKNSPSQFVQPVKKQGASR